MSPPDLPITPLLPQLVATLRSEPGALLHAPTGAGKTTRVPPALWRADLTDGLIVLTEPRRVAARAAASRMAEELGEEVGETVGLRMRDEVLVSDHTRILVVTEGVLLRMLVTDPLLEEVGLLIFDEFHERHLDADLALAMAWELTRELRDDLKVLVMSATLQIDTLQRYMVVTLLDSPGRTYPVEIRHLDRPDDRPMARQAADAASTLARETGGDVLVFLAGRREIEDAARALDGQTDAEIRPFHGGLPLSEQRALLRPGQRQRIILSTNVAETSVTLPGIRAVVDTGEVKQLSRHPRTGLNHLRKVPHSVASADQRAGRAGRVGPGIAWRLWTQQEHRRRRSHDVPEVQRLDLTDALLLLRAWDDRPAGDFPWLEPPEESRLQAAEGLLERLGALDGGGLTDLGRAMATLPVSARLARVLLAATGTPFADQAATLAAALSADRRRGGWDLHAHATGSQQLPRTERRQAERLRRLMRRSHGAGEPAASLAAALAMGFPDRVALAREGQPHVYLLASGRGARCDAHAPLGVALEVSDTEGSEARIDVLWPLDEEDLHAPWVTTARLEPSSGKVIGVRQCRWGALVLAEQTGVPVTRETRHQALVAALPDDPERFLPDDRDLRQLLGRVRFLHRRDPDLPLPDVSPDGLRRLAVDLLRDCRHLEDLHKAPWSRAILDDLEWTARQALDQRAPAGIPIPTGRTARLDYGGEVPVLAVRMQELFGLDRHPTVDGVPIVLHLLAPNRRPAQITSDLPGFWRGSWAHVRKDLKARYPKHVWPDDPLTAAPTARAKPRKR